MGYEEILVYGERHEVVEVVDQLVALCNDASHWVIHHDLVQALRREPEISQSQQTVESQTKTHSGLRLIGRENINFVVLASRKHLELAYVFFFRKKEAENKGVVRAEATQSHSGVVIQELTLWEALLSRGGEGEVGLVLSTTRRRSAM